MLIQAEGILRAGLAFDFRAAFAFAFVFVLAGAFTLGREAMAFAGGAFAGIGRGSIGTFGAAAASISMPKTSARWVASSPPAVAPAAKTGESAAAPISSK